VTVSSCGTAAQAHRLLAELQPELLLLDVHLPDGDAFDVLRTARTLRPMPVIVAMSGQASADESFRLGQCGVRAYLPKPLDLASFNATLDSVLVQTPDLEPHLRASVGHMAIKDVEHFVRETMVDEALAQATGNRRRAASLLRISRELLQHILRRRS
jgi:DNA-binding response OmpR family regulator